MDYRGLHRQRWPAGEQFQIVDEIFCFLAIAFDFEGEDRPAAVREVFAYSLAALDRRIQTDDVLSQPAAGSPDILQLSVRSQRDALRGETGVSSPLLQKQEGVERRKRSSVSRRRIAHAFVTNAAGPTAFCEADAVVSSGLAQSGMQIFPDPPVEFTAVTDHTAKSIPWPPIDLVAE